ncbi:hypothetical protein, partial [Hafnia paralvei]|uniref:hypothetical protein n=1 Tax=Hafnia paralvei TaxID=546367 RepID=UPI0010336FF4
MSISTILTKSIPTFLLLAMCGGLLSACSSQPPKPLLKHAESAGFKNADSYVDRRTRTLIGTTLASTNNVCVDHFNFLKEAKSGQYQGYSNDYNELAKGYRFLNTNKNIMDEDAKKVY